MVFLLEIMKKYITKANDTWDSIANLQMGSSYYSNQLMNANYIHANTVIFGAGVKLNIPDLIITEESKVNLPPWKRKS